MHIPDAVLSPSTSAVAAVVMAPVWAAAGHRVKRSLGERQTPLLALGAAFCFTIMMFNIPAPFGTTVHPVAGTLLAILVGPWAACLGVSIALLIQALFFGDGGIVTYCANSFCMALVLPFVGYTIYRSILLLTRGRYVALAAAIGSYCGINTAAALVALLLGLQPVLFHEANGHALYFPFGLPITLPAMLLTHLAVAGPAEAIVTALVVRFLQSSGVSLYGFPANGAADAQRGASGGTGRIELLWIGMIALVALTPLGLMAKGEAWGEWDAKGVAEQTEKVFGAGRGYTPAGVSAAETHGYHGIRGLEDYGSGDGSNRLGYLGAGLLGAGSIAGVVLIGGRAMNRRASAAPLERILPTRTALADRGGLPHWLCRSEAADTLSMPNAQRTTGAGAAVFVERTLAGVADAAARHLQEERWAVRPGLLQRIDPRAKVIGLLLIVLVATLSRRIESLTALYLVGLLLGALSGIAPLALVRRVWLAVPIFVSAVAIPALFSPVSPGVPLITLLPTPYLAITRPGVLLASTLLLRSGAAVTFVLLLVHTTRWNDLLAALRALQLPRLFLNILSMTYRYLAIQMQMASEVFEARRSRTVGSASAKQGRQFVGVSIGALFQKTMTMADEVHAAMVSRGYRAEMRTMNRQRWQAVDTAWIVVFALVAFFFWKQG